MPDQDDIAQALLADERFLSMAKSAASLLKIEEEEARRTGIQWIKARMVAYRVRPTLQRAIHDMSITMGVAFTAQIPATDSGALRKELEGRPDFDNIVQRGVRGLGLDHETATLRAVEWVRRYRYTEHMTLEESIRAVADSRPGLLKRDILNQDSPDYVFDENHPDAEEMESDPCSPEQMAIQSTIGPPRVKIDPQSGRTLQIGSISC